MPFVAEAGGGPEIDPGVATGAGGPGVGGAGVPGALGTGEPPKANPPALLPSAAGASTPDVAPKLKLAAGACLFFSSGGAAKPPKLNPLSPDGALSSVDAAADPKLKPPAVPELDSVEREGDLPLRLNPVKEAAALLSSSGPLLSYPNPAAGRLPPSPNACSAESVVVDVAPKPKPLPPVGALLSPDDAPKLNEVLLPPPPKVGGWAASIPLEPVVVPPPKPLNEAAGALDVAPKLLKPPPSENADAVAVLEAFSVVVLLLVEAVSLDDPKDKDGALFDPPKENGGADPLLLLPKLKPPPPPSPPPPDEFPPPLILLLFPN